MMLQELRICFVAGTLGQGGAERQLYYILRALRQNGVDLHLLSLNRNEFWEKRIKELGVPVSCVGEPRSKVKRLFRVLSELRRIRPNIVQSQHFYTNFYAAAAARLLRIHEVGAMRNNGRVEVLEAGRLGGWLNLRAPRTIAANSWPAIEYAVERGIPRERLYYLANVVDTVHFRPSSSSREMPLKLIAVARLYEQKRLDRFIRVLARLRNEISRDVSGVIVGKGPLKADLEGQAAALGLNAPDLVFKGSLEDLAPSYREADICVLTSDHEGTPNVLLEAMACGLPVVATNVGGVSKIIAEGENGLLVEPADEPGLFSALVRLINDSQSRMQMGRRARAFVEENHGPELLPGRLLALYRLVVSPRGVQFYPRGAEA
jgi:glycosyltransferase involved in cell wall biosynthesis